MSGNSYKSNPWLADHVIFFGYRWLAWLGTALLVVSQGQLVDPWILAALIFTGALNIPMTLLAQKYVRVSQYNPAMMAPDLLLAILAMLVSGGWNSAFVLYASSSLVMPALLYGWRGGLMAGLALVATNSAALVAAHMPADDEVLRGDWFGLALMMIAPPVFGATFPTLIEFARHLSARRSHRQRQQRERFVGGGLSAGARPELSRFAAFGRNEESVPPHAANDLRLATQTARISAAEKSVEDLRRVVFAPLPRPDMDLADALDVLALRFGQHTGAATRVTLLGRTRLVSPVHRSVLIRLAQEALLNIQQHAHAETATLTLRFDTSSVALLVQDDGVGLLDGTYERPGLHALRAMSYRLAEFGGRLTVFDTEGGGVTVRATMPLE